jgi:hypothetical protein
MEAIELREFVWGFMLPELIKLALIFVWELDMDLNWSCVGMCT